MAVMYQSWWSRDGGDKFDAVYWPKNEAYTHTHTADGPADQ